MGGLIMAFNFKDNVKVTKDVTYTAVWELSVATIKPPSPAAEIKF